MVNEPRKDNVLPRCKISTFKILLIPRLTSRNRPQVVKPRVSSQTSTTAASVEDFPQSVESAASYPSEKCQLLREPPISVGATPVIRGDYATNGVSPLPGTATATSDSSLSSIHRVESAIGYHFRHRRLLAEALAMAGANLTLGRPRCHPQGNKRLALLGDSVMRLALVERWYKTEDYGSKHVKNYTDPRLR